jgi:hypothetical protein
MKQFFTTELVMMLENFLNFESFGCKSFLAKGGFGVTKSSEMVAVKVVKCTTLFRNFKKKLSLVDACVLR